MIATRSKSPSQLVRDKVIERWIGSAPGPRGIYPPGMVSLLAERLKTTRPRIMRWLEDPNGFPLRWDELQEASAEVGGYVKVMFSVKHK